MSLNNKLLLTSAILLFSPQAFAYAQGVREHRSMAPIELKTTAPEALDDEDGALIGTPDGTEGAPEEEDEPDNPTIPADAAISVQPATHISLDTLGLYGEAQGGLPVGIWRNTEHERIVSLLSSLPDSIPSDSIRKLLARLLLTSATPPESANIQQTIFRPRLLALLQLGETSQARRLIELSPKDQRNETIARLEYLAHLLDNDAQWACDHIAERLSQPSEDSAYWQKISLFCLARDKKEAQAQLAVDAGSEQGKPFSDAFLDLIDAMLGRSDAPERLFAAPLALEDAALIALSGKDAFPTGYLASAPLPVARLVADNAAFGAAPRDAASKRLQEIKAGEKRSPAQQAVQSWFAQQFAQSTDTPYHFDQAVQQLAQKSGGAVDDYKQYRFYGMLQGIGFSDIRVKDAMQHKNLQLDKRTGVAPWLRAEMAAAVDGERMGESILLLAIIAGQTPSLAVLDNDVLTELVLALSQLGLQKEAQALAVEAMVTLY